MNRNEYMAALRRALSVLPEEERANALRYYEEYFDDAGPENEQQVISDLGAPSRSRRRAARQASPGAAGAASPRGC